MLEIEKRVVLTRKDFDKLFRFFKTDGKFVKDFKRFTFVQLNNSDFTPDKEGLVDIRLRTTKTGGKFTVKYGNWHANSTREEYEIDFKLDDTINLINMLRVLGYNYFITTYIHRFEFKYKKFNITLDKYFSADQDLMEIEVLAKDRKNIKEIEKDIDDFLLEQKLTPLDSEGMVNYIKGLNDIKEMRVDFTKISVESWFKEWKNWVYCIK